MLYDLLCELFHVRRSGVRRSESKDFQSITRLIALGYLFTSSKLRCEREIRRNKRLHAIRSFWYSRCKIIDKLSFLTGNFNLLWVVKYSAEVYDYRGKKISYAKVDKSIYFPLPKFHMLYRKRDKGRYFYP